MGQPVSKPATTSPFENYQVYTGQAGAGPARGGPPSGMFINNDFVAPPSQIGGYSGGQVQPGRQELYRAQRGGVQMPPQNRMPGHDYGGGMDEFFQDDDNMSRMPNRRGPRHEYDPMTIDPDFYPQRGGGISRGLIDGIREQTHERMIASRAPQYRNRPPPQQLEPKITRYRTVVDEPQGYCPPTQNQGYSSQPQQVQVQPQQSSTPQQILYYDPKTGAIQNPSQTSATPQYGVQQAAAPAQQPMYLSYQQPTQAAPTMAYQQPASAAGYQAPAGYQFSNAMPQGYMMPQYGMAQQQPIVIPAQVFSK